MSVVTRGFILIMTATVVGASFVSAHQTIFPAFVLGCCFAVGLIEVRMSTGAEGE